MKKSPMPSTKKNPKTPQIILRHHLNLPDAPDFISKPPAMSLNAMTKLSEAQLRFLNSQPEVELRRLAEKCREVFVL